MILNGDRRYDPMKFISGQSEMARRIRELDWTNTPLGPLETWPQALRLALSICLNSRFPTAIYWGPDLRLLYNDAWAPIPGPRHPDALGRPAAEVWSDIWHIIEPQFRQITETGEGVFVENQMLPMERYGVPEETYWSYSFSPIRGEDGEIAGIFNSGIELTDTVMTQRRLAMLLELGDRLRNQADARSALREAVQLLGERHGVDRAGLYQVDDKTGEASIADEWLAPGSHSIGPSASLLDFGEISIARSREGKILRINDIYSAPELPDAAARAAFERIDVRAALRVPYVNNGRLEAVMFLHSSTPRNWTDFEIATVQQVLERTWNWIEREESVQREKLLASEIDHRAKNTLAVVQAILRLTHADDIEIFRAKIEERVAALAQAHNMLAAKRWSSIRLGTLLEAELAPFLESGSAATTFDGPDVEIPSASVQSITLLVHELATNALKHGALSGHGGTLDISWKEDVSGTLALTWIERPPPEVELLPADSRPGFGSMLIERVARDYLGGDIVIETTEGVRTARLTIPLQADRGDKSPTHSAPPEATPSAKKGGPKSVLLLEDETIVRIDLEHIIKDLGYGLFGSFGDCSGAEHSIESALPDAAILDINVYGQSSLPLARRLVDRNVPVIFLSGYSEIPSDETGLRERTQYLMKPVVRSQLAKVLKSTIDGTPGDA